MIVQDFKRTAERLRVLPHGCQFNLGLFVQDGFWEGGGDGHPNNPPFPRGLGLELDEETDIESAAFA